METEELSLLDKRILLAIRNSAIKMDDVLNKIMVEVLERKSQEIDCFDQKLKALLDLCGEEGKESEDEFDFGRADSLSNLRGTKPEKDFEKEVEEEEESKGASSLSSSDQNASFRKNRNKLVSSSPKMRSHVYSISGDVTHPEAKEEQETEQRGEQCLIRNDCWRSEPEGDLEKEEGHNGGSSESVFGGSVETKLTRFESKGVLSQQPRNTNQLLTPLQKMKFIMEKESLTVKEYLQKYKSPYWKLVYKLHEDALVRYETRLRRTFVYVWRELPVTLITEEQRKDLKQNVDISFRCYPSPEMLQSRELFRSDARHFYVGNIVKYFEEEKSMVNVPDFIHAIHKQKREGPPIPHTAELVAVLKHLKQIYRIKKFVCKDRNATRLGRVLAYQSNLWARIIRDLFRVDTR